MAAEFIHLNLHTEYSIVDGIVRIDQLFAKCVTYNMPAIALTDQSNLFALVKFYKTAVVYGVKPIIGVEVWLENEVNRAYPFKILLLAQNQQGYLRILKIVSKSFVEGQYLGVPIVKKVWLEELSDGLIVLSGAKSGDVGQALLADDLAGAQNLLKFWQKILPDRYYLELQRTGRPREEEYIVKAFDLAVKLNLPLVATNAVRFLTPEDFEAHEARVCIHGGYVLNDPNRPRMYSEKQYLCSQEYMEQLFCDIPESLVNSVNIAKRCNVELSFDETLLPIFPVPDKNATPEKYFIAEAYFGLEKRIRENFSESSNLANIQNEYNQRLAYEIKVINQMGFASYFLIVADFINWSKKNGIPVGPGRGSGAGSLVAYALGITDLDPIKHELLFERFLNPERVSLPDFDIDFCMDGRDRVIAYVMERYGRDKVAQIITYGTMAARAVVRDVGRVLGYPYGYVDKIAKLIPFAIGMSLEQAFKEEELLQKKYNEEDDVKTLIDLARKLEGIVRNAGKHAGGVIIAPSALTNFMPLYCEAEGEGIITQFDKDDAEAIGLVKFDFLGLRTLTIINWAVEYINKKLDQPIDINKLPLDDEATYKLLQSGKTTAIFQLESRISRDLIKRFKPDCFNDIVALVAIIRPGVLQSGMLDEIVDRKHGRTRITYLHPKLEPVLQPTYGVAIYQEQVMQMAQVLAGYSLGNADLLRRAMGKKKPEEMARQRSIFIAGAAKNNIDKRLANIIFDFMEKFASYGFNKSHSAAYALIAYQTAWLKTHYPAEFMAAVLSSDMDNTDKIVLLLNECRNLGLSINPPDINSSNYRFTVNSDINSHGEILYGLGAIKGVGQAAVESILATRNANGAFKNLLDLCKRIDTRKVNKRVLEALICAGALDKIGSNRASQIVNVELALKMANQYEEHKTSGQIDLFGDLLPDEELTKNYIVVEDWTKDERLKREKSVLGFYLAGHPIEQFSCELDQFIKSTISELVPEIGKMVLIAGFVKSLKIVTTKSGNRLSVITLEDATASIDVTMFAENFTASRDFLVEDQLVIVEGEVVVDNFSDGYRIRASCAMDLDQARAIYVKYLMLKLDANDLTGEVLQNLYKILSDYRGGNCPIFISYNNTIDAKLILGDEWRVHPKNELLSKLKDQFDSTSVCFKY
ncbi:MAG: DNA polymerase III subunit alpha [Coxiellaceae bacterium]|jgi:DNA polymerase-3 subunit alpha|nr:DNA polymerase III subunit alpha [Coxiellaceae bacterium]